MSRRSAASEPTGPDDPVRRARRAFLEGAGIEIASSFPGITRLGGQIVAALYLAEHPRSMDELSAELGCSKSNIFGNVRALESAGIVERRRETGSRHDSYSLRGPYPDVIIGAYVSRLRRVTADKIAI
jgi:DNA-binding transcriptional regulator GbsR (MarR family)